MTLQLVYLQSALTLNNQPEHYATLTKKKKSPILQISKTIIRPDRPQVLKRRQDSDSEDDENEVTKTDYSDLLEDVLGKSFSYDRKCHMAG